MKKIIFLSLLIVFVAIACSRRSVATKEPVIPQRESSISPKTPDNTSTTISSSSTTETMGEVAISAGKNIYTAKCGRCHNLKNVAAYSEQNWVGILKYMAPKAKLTETETLQVSAYVKANAKK